MRSKFEPDALAASARPALLIDPEAYDASEQQFAASLEEPTPQPQPRFVVEEAPGSKTAGESVFEERTADAPFESSCGVGEENPILPATSDPLSSSAQLEAIAVAMETGETLPVQAELMHKPDPVSWRQEVAARLNSYRTRRRPRGPRYPSLRLKFETAEPVESAHAGVIARSAPVTATRQAVALQGAQTAPAIREPASAEPGAEPTARIIEFPRSSVAPPNRLDELAEPVLDRPRILEAPELAPPPPALGGILIAPAEKLPDEKRPGFEVPLQSAPMSQRLLAVGIDFLLVVASVALFANIFLKMTKEAPPLQVAAGATIVLTGLFWVAYQYLLLVYTGITPGLKLAKLQVSRFDGSAVPRRVRRWRVLASVLSGVSLGLGYAWCFLDEDRLCWHDRITRTYMAPIK